MKTKLLIALFVFSAFSFSFIPLQAYSEDLKKEITISFLGDSLTEGLGVAKSAAYPSLVEEILQKKGHSVKIINAGISGSTSASAPSRMRWLLKAKPDWVVLALGANDGLRGLPVDKMKKNLLEAIDIAEKAKVKVLLAGMKVPPNFGADYGKRFESAFKEIASEKKSVVFVPFLLERVGGEREHNISDGIHPNEKGHKIMADMIVKALEPKL